MKKEITRMVRVLIVMMFIFPFIILSVNASAANGALNFDGVNDIVSFNSFPTAEGNITFSAWVKLDKTTGFQTFGSWAYAGDNLLIRSSSGTLQLLFNNEVITGGSLPVGVWQHVAFTKSGRNFELYLNGELKSSGPLGAADRTFTSFHLGCLLGTMHYLDGEMDDVAVWNRVLTAAEIQALRTAPLTGAGLDLIGCYRFDEGVGTNLGDVSGFGNTGTLNNFSLSGASSNWVLSTVFSPTDITLSTSSINENSAADSTIGTFSSTDPEAGDTFTYSLVPGTGATDNGSFSISGNDLRITSSPDYETKNSYSVRIRSTDRGGSIYEKAFTITINNVNEAPTDVTLSSSTINENVAANSTVGAFGSTDPDAGNSFTYTLVAGAGSTDNASFNISGSSLRITNSPDYETKNSYTVRVRTTDQGSLTYEKAFTITINDLNDVNSAPTDLALSASTLNENVVANSTVGTLSSTDPDAGNSFTYTLVAGSGSTDNASFTISGSSLRITNSPDYETKNIYFVRVRTTDQGGLFFEKTFIITINNVNEAPTILSVSVPANTTYSVGQTLTFTVTYDEIINVNTAGGTPSIPVTLATGTVNAAYVNGTGTENLSFRYTVADGNNDPDGVSLGSAIALNGGTLKNVTDVDADLNLNSVASTLNVRVDGLAPTATITAGTTAGGDGLVNASEKTAGFNVVARSSEGDGTLYVVPSATAKNMGAITGAAIESAASAGANGDTTIAISANNPGVINGVVYKVYAVDGVGNISAISGVAFTADFSAPTLTAGAVNRTSDTAGTVKFTSSEAGKYYYALVTDGAAAPAIDTNGAGTDCITAETTITNPTGLTAGAKDIYIVVKDAAGNVSSANKLDIVAYAAPDNTAPTLTAGAANRTSDTAGTVKFTSNEAGKYYYSLVSDGAAAPGVDTNGAGTDCTTAETTITNPIGLTAGAKDIYIAVKDAAGNVSSAIKLDMAAYVAPSGGNSGGGSSGGGGSSAPSQTPVTIIVNGDGISAGTSKDTVQNGKTITTITLDEKKLEQKLGKAGSGAVVEVPANTNSGTIIGELNGQMIKSMELQQAVVEIKNHSATYTLPAKQINIDAVSQQIGTTVTLKDINVQIEIMKGNQGTATLVENAAKKGDFTIVAPPVEFNIRCTYAGKTVEVSKFNAYVERAVAIPDGVDPTKITTGVIVDADGTVRHVPTKITVTNGKYYAKINSLTNSTYSVVYNPVSFKDVENHWAKASVNNMGSRMVVSGAGSGQFEPDRSITRAEFAAIVVRALGLKPGTGTNGFGDVSGADWYCKSVETASAYGIINGYDKTTFGPNDKITREQAMAMIARTLKTTGLKITLEAGEADKLLAAYSDYTLSSVWAKEGTASCLKAGIVSGKAPGTLAPQNEITRAEVAVIIERLLKKSGLI